MLDRHLFNPERARLHKLATIHARSIVRSLGKLDPSQHETIAAKLQQLVGLSAG